MWTEPMSKKITGLGKRNPQNIVPPGVGGDAAKNLNRRGFLGNAATGFGGLALAAMLQRDA